MLRVISEENVASAAEDATLLSELLIFWFNVKPRELQIMDEIRKSLKRRLKTGSFIDFL